MKQTQTWKQHVLSLLAVSLLSTPVLAQNSGVVESRGVAPGQNSSASANNSDALALLLEQNQQLRAELQALRGMIEEQGFEVRKLQRDSLSRYTNIDDRLSALEANAATAARTGNAASSGTNAISGSATQQTGSTGISANTTPNSNNANSARVPAPGIDGRPNGLVYSSSSPETSNRTASSRGTLQPAVLSEQQLYQMAYDSVINSNFERSLAEFDQYLSIYPEGRFVTNAHYWKGQAYLYLDRFAEARDSYEIIIEQYPDNAKLPDAMYGLGLAYQGLGNVSRARQLLNDIKRRFPNTGVANLADTRLLTLD